MFSMERLLFLSVCVPFEAREEYNSLASLGIAHQPIFSVLCMKIKLSAIFARRKKPGIYGALTGMLHAQRHLPHRKSHRPRDPQFYQKHLNLDYSYTGFSTSGVLKEEQQTGSPRRVCLVEMDRLSQQTLTWQLQEYNACGLHLCGFC